MAIELEDLDAQLTRIEGLVAAKTVQRFRNANRALKPKERPWWKEELHPRGKDGRFIQNGGWVRGQFMLSGPGGQGAAKDFPPATFAQVKQILPNREDPNDPIIELVTSDGRTGYARASEAIDAPAVKARFSGKPVTVQVDAEELRRRVRGETNA